MLEQKAIAVLAEDEISLGKIKKVYGKKGEKVEVTVKNGEVLIVRNLRTNEKFSVNKNNLIF